MQSPLPDSSALEAGIIEDSRPSRLSRVQDNVRHLLRNSLLSTDRNSVIASPRREQAYADEGYESSNSSPLAQQHPRPVRLPYVLSSPTRPIPTQVYAPHAVLPTPPPSPTRSQSWVSPPASHSTSRPEGSEEIPPTSQTMLFPPPLAPSSYSARVQEMAHQSALFNAHAISALNHPDLSNPAGASYMQQKAETRQQRAWKTRSADRRRRQRASLVGSQRCLCVLSGLLLAAVVATYLGLAVTNSTTLTATFHILFVLGILLATIVFAHTLVRMCLYNRGLAGPARFVIVSARDTKSGRRRKHPRHPSGGQRQFRKVHSRQRHDENDVEVVSGLDGLDPAREFLPPTPIQVLLGSDNPAPQDQPSTSHSTRFVDDHSSGRDRWNQPTHEVTNPPPAYGRWRGSVRANPNLLHWQPSPSLVSPKAPSHGSPTYEEAIARGGGVGGERTGPPSYATREMNATPGRMTREDLAQAQVGGPRPEMVEVSGVGMAV